MSSVPPSPEKQLEHYGANQDSWLSLQMRNRTNIGKLMVATVEVVDVALDVGRGLLGATPSEGLVARKLGIEEFIDKRK